MKLLLSAILAFLPLVSSLSAQIIYSGVKNLSIDATSLEGVYINFETGATAVEYPADFDEGPWINFSLGGYGIFNGEGVQPVAVSDAAYDPELASDYYLNLPEGTAIDDASAFVVEGFASVNHIGTEEGTGKFVPGELGILGFVFQKTADSSFHFGWIRFSVGEGGADGLVVDWAYQNTSGAMLEAGAVPEPSTMVMLTAVAGGALWVRRRR